MEAYAFLQPVSEVTQMMSLERFVILHHDGIPEAPDACLVYFYKNVLQDAWVDPSQRGVPVNRPCLSLLKLECVTGKCSRTGERVGLDVLRDLFDDRTLHTLELVHVPNMSVIACAPILASKRLRDIIAEGLDLTLSSLVCRRYVSLAELKAFLGWMPHPMPNTLAYAPSRKRAFEEIYTRDTEK